MAGLVGFIPAVPLPTALKNHSICSASQNTWVAFHCPKHQVQTLAIRLQDIYTLSSSWHSLFSHDTCMLVPCAWEVCETGNSLWPQTCIQFCLSLWRAGITGSWLLLRFWLFHPSLNFDLKDAAHQIFPLSYQCAFMTQWGPVWMVRLARSRQ